MCDEIEASSVFLFGRSVNTMATLLQNIQTAVFIQFQNMGRIHICYAADRADALGYGIFFSCVFFFTNTEYMESV